MSILILYLIFAIVGSAAGVLGGLLGIGGGVITVPCLFYLFHFLDLPQTSLMHMAIATSLAAMILNAAAAAWAHQRRKHVLFDVFRRFVPGIIIGSVLGAVIADQLSEMILEICFGVFLCALAFYFYRQKPVVAGSYKLPSPAILSGLGGVIGMISNLLGIGGGSLTVPLLTSFKIRDKNAIGTSAAITFVTLVCGTLSYLILGWNEIPGEPLGLIHLSAFFIVGATAACCAPLGAYLTARLDPAKTRRIFSLVLALTGLSLLL